VGKSAGEIKKQFFACSMIQNNDIENIVIAVFCFENLIF
jgi:hypothetical protein